MDSVNSRTVLRGKYRLLKVLQKLPYSLYYVGASVLSPGTRWAIKEIKLSFENEEEKSKRLEIFQKNAAKFKEVNGCLLNPLVDYFIENESGYLVFEFIPGYRLEEILKLRRKPFSEYQILDFAMQASQALICLHEAGMVFCDLNPSNIIVTPEGTISLTDYGLGKLLARRDLKEPKWGTLGYAPPEQFGENAVLDEKVDIYALGIILYQMLTLRDPVKSEGEIQSIRQLNQEVSENLESVILKAACKKREGRYSKVKEFLEDLYKITRFQPIIQQEDESWLRKLAREISKPFRKGN